MNQFVNIPVLAANGVGAPVDVSKMGATKTIVVGGVGGGTTVTIEYATDDVGAGPWAPLPNGSFQGPGRVTFDFAPHWLRAVTTSYSSGAPNADCGASGDGAKFVQIGAGSTDISALPAVKTVVVAGAGILEVSEDGNSWSQAFAFQNAGGQTQRVYGQFARWTGGGTVWMGASIEGSDAGYPPFPTAGVPVTTTVYARTTGSDTSGNGTLANPYRSFARAILDVPKFIDPGTRWIIDITDLGTELLPAEWSCPQFVMTGEMWFVPDQSFLFASTLSIRAYPKLVVTPNAQIGAADAGVVSTIQAGLCKLAVPGAAWVPGALKGKHVRRSSGAQAASCCIADNTGTELTLCNTAGAFNGGAGPLVLAAGETIDIVEPSAKLTAPPSAGNRNAVLFQVPMINFMGIAIECSIPGAGNGGLQLANAFDIPFFELCALDEPGFVQCGAVQVGLFSTTVTGFMGTQQTNLTPRRSYWNIPEQFFIFGGYSSQFRTTVFEAGSASIAAGGGVAGPVAMPTFAFINCWWKGAVGDAVAIIAPMRADLTNCQIDNSSANGVSADGPCKMTLTNVLGVNNAGIGAVATDGAHIQADIATNIAGVGGAYKSGNLAVVGAWPGAAFNATDLTAGNESLSRIFAQ